MSHLKLTWHFSFLLRDINIFWMGVNLTCQGLAWISSVTYTRDTSLILYWKNNQDYWIMQVTLVDQPRFILKLYSMTTLQDIINSLLFPSNYIGIQNDDTCIFSHVLTNSLLTIKNNIFILVLSVEEVMCRQRKIPYKLLTRRKKSNVKNKIEWMNFVWVFYGPILILSCFRKLTVDV